MTDEMRARLIEIIAQLEELYRDRFEACHKAHCETIRTLEGR